MERTTPSSGTLADVAEQLDRGGIECVPADDLATVVAAARAAAASEVIIGVFVDPTEPEVARERAFVKLAASIIFAAPATASVTLAA